MASHCVVCGSEVSERDEFCEKCGAALKKECGQCGAKHWRGVVSCEFCEATFAPEDRMRRCDQCQEVYDRSVAHCPFCGTKNTECDGTWNENKSSRNYNPSLAMVLCLFLGGFGLHKFYMGENTSGVIYLGLTLVTLLTQFWALEVVVLIACVIDLFKIYANAPKR